MKADFMDYWRLYAPQRQYSNRFLACRRLWEAMDCDTCNAIVRELEQRHIREPTAVHEKNPYFYLTDWQPPQPEWLTPAQTSRLMAERVPLAVAYDPHSQTYRTCTRSEADSYGLKVHHYM